MLNQDKNDMEQKRQWWIKITLVRNHRIGSTRMKHKQQKRAENYYMQNKTPVNQPKWVKMVINDKKHKKTTYKY